MNTVAANLVSALSDGNGHTLTIVAATVGCADASGIATSDIRAFYQTTEGTTQQVWLLTNSRVMRVEVTDEAALAITFPLRRVSRVAELYSSGGLAVTVEVDADSRTTIGERQVFSNYTLLARDAVATSNLSEFSRQMRLRLDEHGA